MKIIFENKFINILGKISIQRITTKTNFTDTNLWYILYTVQCTPTCYHFQIPMAVPGDKRKSNNNLQSYSFSRLLRNSDVQ